MKKKIVHTRDLQIRIKDSRKIYKFRIASDTRLKELANEMCRRLGFDPYSTEWAFYLPIPGDYEAPINSTLRMLEMSYNRTFEYIIAHCTNVDIFHNEIEDITDRIRPFNYEKQS